MPRRSNRQSQSALEPLEKRHLLSAGSLDFHFGDHGSVLEKGNKFGEFTTITELTDGRILAIGRGTSLGLVNGEDIALIRFNSDGTRDTTFANDGAMTIDISGYDDVPVSAFVLPDGKILVGASLSTRHSTNGWRRAGFLRFNSDGALDQTFGDHGVVIGPDTLLGTLADMKIQSDGKIVGLGYAQTDSTRRWYLMRLDADGHFDQSFGNGGIVVSEFAQREIMAHKLAIQSDGKIIAVGTSNWLRAVRYNTDGSLDQTFGQGGEMLITERHVANTCSIAIKPDGKLLLGISGYELQWGTLTLYQLNADGSRDAAWGENGRIITTVGEFADSYALKFQSDGKLLQIGQVDGKMAVVRYNEDGTVDESFGVHGVAKTTIDGIAFDALIQNDQKILTAGTASENWDSMLVRFMGDLDDFPAKLDGAGILNITGTGRADRILVSIAAGLLSVDFDGDIRNFDASTIASIMVDAGLGNDFVSLGNYNGTSTILGGDGNDTIIGGAGKDSLIGGSGADSIDGAGGNDFIDGEQDNDTLLGGDGVDRIFGGDGRDRLCGGNGNDLCDGETGRDSVNGNGGNDQLAGGDGNDLVDGGSGNDRMDGSAGNDNLAGNNGADSIYGGNGADQLFGGSSKDQLYGGSGNDNLSGGAGADILIGNKGIDTLIGGDGKDNYLTDRGDNIVNPVQATTNSTAIKKTGSYLQDLLA